MRRLLSFLKPHRPIVIALIAANILLSAMLTIGPLVTKAIVDDVISARQLQLLLPYLGAFIAVTVVRTTMTYFYSYGQNKLGQLVMTDVRAALYRKMLALQFSLLRQGADRPADVAHFKRCRKHAFVSVADSGRIDQPYAHDHVGQHRDLAAGCVAGADCHRPADRLRRRVVFDSPQPARAVGQAARALCALSATLQDSPGGHQSGQGICAGAAGGAQVCRSRCWKCASGNQQIQDTWNTRWVFVGSIGRFMQLALFAVGGFRVMNGDISLGTLVAVISLSMLLLGAINALGTQLNAFSQTATASVRIFELLDEPVTIRSPRDLAPVAPTLAGAGAV